MGSGWASALRREGQDPYGRPEEAALGTLFQSHRRVRTTVSSRQSRFIVWADLKGYKLESGRKLKPGVVTVHIDDDERSDIGLHLDWE